jgi:trimeric autotransporter adhesin
MTTKKHRKKSMPSLFFVALTLVSFAIAPLVHAVVPPPDGGYPGFNTAEGQNALLSLTTGAGNTAVGWFSLGSNTDASFNTALGAGALFANISQENTGIGVGALLSNTTGPHNTAIGALALFSNTEGNVNTAVGLDAMFSNTTGIANTANGAAALRQNIDGDFNSAFGVETLYNNTEGRFNTAMGGYRALDRNTTGDSNTGVGSFALFNNQTGNLNTAIGSEAGEDITGSGNVCIGEGVLGEAGVDDRTYIRNVNTTAQSFSAGVNNYVTVRLSDGRLGHTQVVSSRRYKENIKPLAAASEALYALKPVSFRLKKEYDEAQPLAFGLIAEEVEKVDPALVYRNNKGQVESVRYEMVNAMLLNEFLKEHRKVEKLEVTVLEQQKQIKALTAGLEKVSAQLEMNKAPRVVENTY